MNKFKVGDKVRCIEKNYTFYGQIGTIESIKYFNETTPLIMVGGLIAEGFSSSKTWAHFEKDLELVEPQYTFTSKFNIGDIVVYKNVEFMITGIDFRETCTMYVLQRTPFDHFLSVEEYKLKLYKEPTYELSLLDLTKEQRDTILEYVKK